MWCPRRGSNIFWTIYKKADYLQLITKRSLTLEPHLIKQHPFLYNPMKALTAWSKFIDAILKHPSFYNTQPRIHTYVVLRVLLPRPQTLPFYRSRSCNPQQLTDAAQKPVQQQCTRINVTRDKDLHQMPAPPRHTTTIKNFGCTAAINFTVPFCRLHSCTSSRVQTYLTSSLHPPPLPYSLVFLKLPLMADDRRTPTDKKGALMHRFVLRKMWHNNENNSAYSAKWGFPVNPQQNQEFNWHRQQFPKRLNSDASNAASAGLQFWHVQYGLSGRFRHRFLKV